MTILDRIPQNCIPSLAVFLSARPVANPQFSRIQSDSTSNVDVCIVCGSYVTVTWSSISYSKNNQIN